MKKISINLRYITFSSVFIIASFVLSQQVSANTYYKSCSTGGNVGTLVSLSAQGPFNPPITFNATGQIVSSTCGPYKIAKLRAQVKNNTTGLWAGNPVILIQPTLIPPGTSITSPVPATALPQVFSSPSTPGSYAVRFTTALDIIWANNSDQVAALRVGVDSASPYIIENWTPINDNGIINGSAEKSILTRLGGTFTISCDRVYSNCPTSYTVSFRKNINNSSEIVNHPYIPPNPGAIYVYNPTSPYLADDIAVVHVLDGATASLPADLSQVEYVNIDTP